MTSLLLALLLPHADATTVRSYLRNREGVHSYNDKAYYPAYQAFLKALEEDPLNPAVQLNLARTFEANEEFEKAAAAYKGALQLVEKDPTTRFEVLFNLGNVLGRMGKIDEALAAYQQCLDMVPDSKEVKTNIELLFQGGGGGGGESNKDQKDNKDDKGKSKPKEGEDKKQNPQDQKDQQKEKNKPKPFQSKDLSPQDVKKILDEIKNQEQSIRAQEYEKKGKDQGNAKDW